MGLTRNERRIMKRHIEKLVPKLRTLDMEWGYEYINHHPWSKELPRPLNEEAILAGMHKLRVQLGGKYFYPDEIETSCVWLEANGFTVPEEGEF